MSLVTDDVKLAELSSNSFERKNNVTFLTSGSKHTLTRPIHIFSGDEDPPTPGSTPLGGRRVIRPAGLLVAVIRLHRYIHGWMDGYIDA